MTHAVLRGKPTAAQLYLDGLLNEVLVSRGKIPDAEGRERVSLPQILFHCLAKNLEGVFIVSCTAVIPTFERCQIPTFNSYIPSRNNFRIIYLVLNVEENTMTKPA